ncbi:MAG: acetylglutamate kinase [Candidatus Diapherotrites archaeon]
MDEEMIEKVFRVEGIPPEEGKRFLEKFRAIPPMNFAVIKVSGECLETDESKNAITKGLNFLFSLGLYPIVIHGAGKGIDRAMHEKGLKIKKVGGLRFTGKKTLKIVMDVSGKVNAEFVGALNDFEPVAEGLVGKKIFIAEPLEEKKYGFVGEVKIVKLSDIKKAVSGKRIPVVPFFGFKGKQAYNINADEAANHLVKAVKPAKFIVFTEVGGVLDKNGKVISELDIQGMQEMIESGAATEGMKVKLEQIIELMHKMPNGFRVHITSPKKFIRELFTDKGSGTLVCKRL